MGIILSVAAGVLAALLALKIGLVVLGAASLALIAEAAIHFEIRDETMLRSFFALLAIPLCLAAATYVGLRAWAFVFSYFETKRGE